MNKYTREEIVRLNPHHRDYKTRNILSLEERIEVIRAYESNPIYQRIAEKFNCSSKQIKNIVANKDAVLLYYANYGADGTTNEARRRRQQKITFLGDVIYEFVLRAVYHEMPISATMVSEKALQVKEAIAIGNFSPNQAWIEHFKTTYEIPEFDLKTLQSQFTFREPKKSSFSCMELIQFVSRQEKANKPQKISIQQDENGNPNENQIANQKYRIVVSTQNKSNCETTDPGEPSIAYENICDDMDHDMENSNSKFNYEPSVIVSLDSDEEIEEENAKQESKTSSEQLKALADITTCQEALQHLKVLEDFAMLKDNYRAVGLITQLEEVLKNPPKCTDFDD